MMFIIAATINLNITSRMIQLITFGEWSHCLGLMYLSHLNFCGLILPYLIRGLHCLYMRDDKMRRRFWWLYSERCRLAFIGLVWFFWTGMAMTNILHVGTGYKWTETLANSDNKCVPDNMHYLSVSATTFLSIVFCLVLARKLKKAPKDAVFVRRELKLLLAGIASLYVLAILWLPLQNGLGLQTVPMTAILMIVANEIFFVSSFVSPFKLDPQNSALISCTGVSTGLSTQNDPAANLFVNEAQKARVEAAAGAVEEGGEATAAAALGDPSTYARVADFCGRHFVPELPLFLRRALRFLDEEGDDAAALEAEFHAIVDDHFAARAPYAVALPAGQGSLAEELVALRRGSYVGDPDRRGALRRAAAAAEAQLRGIYNARKQPFPKYEKARTTSSGGSFGAPARGADLC